MKIFIFFTTKLYNAHLTIFHMIEDNAAMLIIGKILEENLNTFNMMQNHANTGNQMNL